jgi:hypothetical protein
MFGYPQHIIIGYQYGYMIGKGAYAILIMLFHRFFLIGFDGG